MSYEKKVDEMIAKYIALYQEEQSLAREMATAMAKPIMVHGYLARTYNPPHPDQLPPMRHFTGRKGGRLSNGVPRALSAKLHNGSLLGIYNPGLRKSPLLGCALCEAVTEP